MKRSHKKRVEKLENQNTETESINTIERVIVDSREQVENPDRFSKVLIHEDDNRRIFELKRKTDNPNP